MTGSIQFLLNDRQAVTHQTISLPVLDYLRQVAQLRGTKEGCREGGCGACTVLLGERTGDHRPSYKPIAACLLPLGELQGKHLVTIEGLNQPQLSPVQQAIVDWGATQCGFCTPGIVMAVTGYLLSADRPTAGSGLNQALSGNLCRCTGYAALRRAVQAVLQRFQGITDLTTLVAQGVVPAYFLDIPQRLERLPVVLPPAPEGSVWVAGGTEVYVENDASLNRRSLRLLSGLASLRGIREQSGAIHIGALTTFEDLVTHPLIRQCLPQVPGLMERIASWPIRNRATVGGNIIAASPIADVAVLLLALNAQVVLQRGPQQRTLALREFFQAYKVTALQPDELLTEIVLPPVAAGQQLHFEKIAKRKTLDCASVNSAIALQVEGNVIQQVSLSMGGVAPMPLFLKATSAYFSGQPITPELIAGAFPLLQAEVSPISDVRGSASYKRLLARQLLIAHFTTLLPHLLQVRDLYAVS